MSVKQESALPTQPNIEAAPTKLHRNILETAKGSGIVATGRLFEYGARFILAFLLARALGAENYGLYSLAITTGFVLSGVTTLGFDSGLVRYVAILNDRKDEKGLWGALQIGIGGSALASTVTAIVLFAASYTIAYNTYHDPALVPLLQILAVFLPFSTLIIVVSAATRGFKRMDYSVIAKSGVNMIYRLVLTLILFFIGLNPVTAVLIYASSDLVATLFLFYFLNKDFSLRRPIRDATYNVREMLGFSVPLWISGLLSTFRQNIQTILMGASSTALNVGIFSLTSNLNMVGRVAFNSITLSTKPLISELHANGDFVQLGQIYKATTRWAFTLNLPVFLAMILLREEILAFFGQAYVGGASALVILAVSELVNVGTGLCGSIIDMTGQTRMKLFNSVSQLVTIILLNVLLIPRWGVIGAAVAALAGVALTNSLRLFQVWYLYRLQPYSWGMLKPVVAATVAFVIGLGARQLFPDQILLFFLIAVGAVLVIVYSIILIMLGLPQEERIIVDRSWQRTKVYLAKVPLLRKFFS